ncbi:DNA polymerase III subunit theta [Pantoea ananatis]|uniref:DNA polymerase III subunit theta n=1 Tax=Pantoea ananas TaxID=553 RepID=A0AAJ1FVY4_PANAN|nr:DNA polymerase III subunit theta [Pantoea ananatis]MCW0346213.1 DNA polymerase III subunit theta [Pantoea ananatis]
MPHNLASRERAERDKVNVDLAASGVAYRELLNPPVIPAQVEHQQPEELRDYFRERLANYRNLSLNLPGVNDPVYHKEPKD